MFPMASSRSTNDKLIETAVRLYRVNTNVCVDYSVHDALYEASGIHGITDLHNDKDDEQYGDYEDMVHAVNTPLGIRD